MGYSFVDGWWLDVGKEDVTLHANALILGERARRGAQGCGLEGGKEGCGGEGVEDYEEHSKEADGDRGDLLIEGSFIGSRTSIGNVVRVMNTRSSIASCSRTLS
ncbi:MAG: hypothetical protein QXL96_09055 [Ignisphaera sp.]